MSPSHPPMSRCYAGATVVLGTMHGKQAAIAPALYETAGLFVTVTPEFDTDRFGTFARDIARGGTMEDAALAKANAAIDASGLDLGLASEGSYGPHPAIPMIPSGHEMLVFVDRTRNLTVTEQLLTADVTFAHTVVRDRDMLAPFLKRVGFPEQRLVVRPADRPDAVDGMTKGVAGDEELAVAFATARGLSSTGEVLIETDMRAFGNPQRLRTIGILSRRLGERLGRHCPRCDAPGFGSDRAIPGLPCAECGAPTAMPLAIERRCLICEESMRLPTSHTTADPGHCPSCNP